MGRTINSETKSVFLKFRITESFKKELIDLKARTPGCAHMELQQYIVRLIELGIREEDRLTTFRERTIIPDCNLDDCPKPNENVG